MLSPARFRLGLLLIVALWLALRLVYWNGYYTEDAPGYVTDAIWLALGEYRARDHVNGLNVGTYLPVALPIWILGKREAALALWPLASSLAGLLSMAGATRILFGRPYGLLAAFLYATYPGDVFFSTVVMPDALQAGWVSLSLFLIVAAHVRPESQRRGVVAGAGVAMGVCHLIRANDVLLLPVGITAVLLCSMLWAGRRPRAALTDCAVYAAGWAFVGAAEGLAYLWASGDFLHRFHVVDRHYGTLDSIARAGLNTDPRTIPFSILPPVTWWLHGGWGELNQDQAYHGLLFCWAAACLVIGGLALGLLRGRADPRARAGFAVAVVWLLWPLLYHQFGSQSVTQLVPIHRLSRHLVVYAPGAMFAIVAGCFLTTEAVRTATGTGVRRLAAAMAAATLAVLTWFNWKGEQMAFEAFHRVKDTYVRILERLPEGTQTIVADPGDLCFLDFWMNPLGSEPVRMVPFAAYQRCDEMPEGVVLTHSNPGWHGQAPIIVETVRRLPCLAHPPATWRLLYQGYPERVFQIAAGGASAGN
jgi:Dolichyl-phosphate-mannose-protein mannosyltransferase